MIYQKQCPYCKWMYYTVGFDPETRKLKEIMICEEYDKLTDFYAEYGNLKEFDASCELFQPNRELFKQHKKSLEILESNKKIGCPKCNKKATYRIYPDEDVNQLFCPFCLDSFFYRTERIEPNEYKGEECPGISWNKCKKINYRCSPRLTCNDCIMLIIQNDKDIRKSIDSPILPSIAVFLQRMDL